MAEENRQRIDKWLFFARVGKSRTLAAKIVQSGRVRLNSQKIDQPAHAVKTGDVLTIALERRVVIWRVIAFGSRRGPAEEARMLYEDLTPPAAKVEKAGSSVGMPKRDPGRGRPTKKERRRLDRFFNDI